VGKENSNGMWKKNSETAVRAQFMLAEDRASALVSSRKGKPYEVITCNTLKLVSLHTAVGSSF